MEQRMKTTSEITLYDLMGTDFTVYMKKQHNGRYDLSMIGEDNQMFEDGIHAAAVDSFAELCRDFLYFYDKYNK